MFDFKLTEDLSIVATLTCPHCDRQTEHNLSDKRAGDLLRCACGFAMPLADENLAKARMLLLNFQGLIKNLGK